MAIVRAKSAMRISPRRIIHAGDLLDAADPVVKARESMFEPVEVAVARTAAQPKKTAAKKAAPKSDG